MNTQIDYVHAYAFYVLTFMNFSFGFSRIADRVTAVTDRILPRHRDPSSEEVVRDESLKSIYNGSHDLYQIFKELSDVERNGRVKSYS